jgi:hypothetical protein
MVMSVTTFSVQPMPNVLLLSDKRFHDTVT